MVRDVSEALQKVNGTMTLDDRQGYNLARQLVEPFGYTVVQAVRKWERSKAPYRGKNTADVVGELIAAKRSEQLSIPYLNRLEDHLKSFEAVFPRKSKKYGRRISRSC